MKEDKIQAFFDSNIIIDALTGRDNSFFSSRLFKLVAYEHIDGFIASKQLTDIAYVLKKYHFNNQEIKALIKSLCDMFTVLPTFGSDITYVLGSNMFFDLEDELIDEIAHVNCVKYLVTNNKKDFEGSRNIIFTPKEMVTLYDATIL